MADYTIKFDPESERLIREIHTMLHDFTKSGKKALSDDWLTIKNIVKAMDCSPKTARRRIMKEKLKGKQLGRTWYYHISEVERLLGKPGSE